MIHEFNVTVKELNMIISLLRPKIYQTGHHLVLSLNIILSTNSRHIPEGVRQRDKDEIDILH